MARVRAAGVHLRQSAVVHLTVKPGQAVVWKKGTRENALTHTRARGHTGERHGLRAPRTHSEISEKRVEGERLVCIDHRVVVVHVGDTARDEEDAKQHGGADDLQARLEPRPLLHDAVLAHDGAELVALRSDVQVHFQRFGRFGDGLGRWVNVKAALTRIGQGVQLHLVRRRVLGCRAHGGGGCCGGPLPRRRAARFDGGTKNGRTIDWKMPAVRFVTCLVKPSAMPACLPAANASASSCLLARWLAWARWRWCRFVARATEQQRGKGAVSQREISRGRTKNKRHHRWPRTSVVAVPVVLGVPERAR